MKNAMILIKRRDSGVLGELCVSSHVRVLDPVWVSRSFPEKVAPSLSEAG